MYVVIMGCGRVGSSLARALVRVGHEVTVIDRDPSSFRRLGEGFTGQEVVGVGFDRDVLTRAGIERADAFAAVSSGDNSNIISARVAREMFGVERVVARIYDAKRAEVYERLGIPTIATVPWTTDRFLRSLIGDNSTTTWRDPTGAVAVTQLTLHEDWSGRTVRELERELGVRVAFVLRFGQGLLPESKTIVQAEDVVYVAATSGTVGEAVALAAKPPASED